VTRDAAIVLLTLDEVEGLTLLWDRIPRGAFAETFAVDGGSTDGTRAFLEAHGVPVHDQPSPGRGVAFRVAAEVARASRLVFFSPDGNEDPADIERLDDLLLGGARLAIASRFAPGARNEEDGGWLRPRARVNRAFTAIANRLFQRGFPVTDAINGFRAMARSDLDDLATTARRFPIEYQITLRAMERGWPIAEIPTHEDPRAGGASKCRSWPAGRDHLLVLLAELPRARFLRGPQG
jgi:hypothetical protein